MNDFSVWLVEGWGRQDGGSAFVLLMLVCAAGACFFFTASSLHTFLFSTTLRQKSESM